MFLEVPYFKKPPLPWKIPGYAPVYLQPIYLAIVIVYTPTKIPIFDSIFDWISPVP